MTPASSDDAHKVSRIRRSAASTALALYTIPSTLAAELTQSSARRRRTPRYGGHGSGHHPVGRCGTPRCASRTATVISADERGGARHARDMSSDDAKVDAATVRGGRGRWLPCWLRRADEREARTGEAITLMVVRGAACRATDGAAIRQTRWGKLTTPSRLRRRTIRAHCRCRRGVRRTARTSPWQLSARADRQRYKER